MINKKLKILYIKFVILILCVLIVARIFVLVLSKYESISSSYANVDVAFYLFEEDFKSMTLNLGTILPQDNKYIYEFSIGNEKDEKVAEISLDYELTLRTTTNLPLTYELYMNESYDDENATNIIKEDIIDADEHGTFFRYMSTEKISLLYTEGKTNLYQLVVNFPANYNDENYQNILEMLEININSQQKTVLD